MKTPKKRGRKPERPLTKKQQDFITELLRPENKGKTGNEIARLAGYARQPDKRGTKILNEFLAERQREAEATIVEVMEYSKSLGKSGTKEGAAYAAVALNAGKEVLDRTQGKSIQRVQQHNTNVTLNIDLTTATTIEDVPAT